MQESPFESLAAFATEDRIIRLIAKERGKYTAKHGGSVNPFASDPLYQELRQMCPPHKLWKNPGRGRLPVIPDHGIAHWTGKKRKASIRVYQAIRKSRRSIPDAAWLQRLDAFVRSVQETLADTNPLTLETPRVLAKFKERDTDTGDCIFRPICKYSDLKTKIILALAYQYILAKFDGYFHRNMLFMRAVRCVGPNDYRVPKFLDAIDMVSDYRKYNDRSTIYVGECDIQKFYDIFNHDVIVDCFEDLFAEVSEREGASDEDFDPLRRVITAYLESFNYPEHVMGKNGDSAFWDNKARRLATRDNPNPVCRFKWVKEAQFVSSGCYTEEQFRVAKESGKLGIPQGGALSGIIVNVVMRMVDKPIVTRDDPGRLFIRYCDDILLMHTDRQSCVDYLENYYDQLIRCKLIPHPRKDVADFKSGEKTKAGFWHAKSKNVYLWGSGDGDASDWVAFVGYEMRRTGEVRIRKDKIDAETKRIAHRYYDIINAKAVTSGKTLTDEDREKLIERMDSLSKHILNFERATDNKYTRSQARRLDNYLYKKTRKAADLIGIADTRQAARERVTYLEKVKEMDSNSD